MNTNPFILDEIGAAILYYYEEFEFECTKNNIRNPWKYEPVTGTSEEVKIWKEERDTYIREREKYIALKLLDEYGWEPFEKRCSSSSYLKDLLEQMSPCMSKLDPQCSFFCKNYYNCIGDKDGQN